jgi:hypothetical protein
MFMILLTTCQLQKDRVADLFRLTASVEAAIVDGEVHKLRHIILLQACTSQQCDEIRSELPNWVELLSSEEAISSPAARNVMIRHVLDHGAFDPSAIVGFPDDDACILVAALRALRVISEIPTLSFWSRAMAHPPPQTSVARRIARRFSKRSPAERARQFLFVPSYWRSSAGFTLCLASGPSLAAARTPSSCTAPFIVRASTVFAYRGSSSVMQRLTRKRRPHITKAAWLRSWRTATLLRQRAWPSSASWRSALGW